MEENIPPVIQNPLPQVAPLEPPQSNNLQSNGKRKTIIILAIVLALVVVIGVALFVFAKDEIKVLKLTPTPIPYPTVVSQSPTVQPTTSAAIELKLEKDKSVLIPNSEIAIVYNGASLPNPKCADCTTTTDITLTYAGEEKVLNYICGGIAGQCTDKLSAFEYEITLTEATESTATVKVVKK